MSCPTACGARRHGRDGRPHRPRVGKPAPASASRGRAFYASVYPSVSARRLPLSAPRRRTAQDDFCRTGEETAFGFSLRACIPHKNFISVSSVRRARALLSRAAVTSLRRFALSLRRRTAPRTGLRPRAVWLRLRAGCAHASRGLKARAPHGRRGAARRGVACGRVRPCGGSGRRLLLKTDRSMAACCTANGRHTGSMAAGPSGYRPRQICPPGKTDSARCWDKPECSGMLYCK